QQFAHSLQRRDAPSHRPGRAGYERGSRCVDLRRDLVEWSECGIHAATLRRSTDSVHQVSGRRIALCVGLVAVVIASCGNGSNPTAATTTAAAPTTAAAGATTTAAATASTSAAP